MHWRQTSVTSCVTVLIHLLVTGSVFLFSASEHRAKLFYTEPNFCPSFSSLPGFWKLNLQLHTLILNIWSTAVFKNGSKKKSKLYIFWRTTTSAGIHPIFFPPTHKQNQWHLSNTKRAKGTEDRNLECRLQQPHHLEFHVLLSRLRLTLSTNLYQTWRKLHERQSWHYFSSS